MTKISYDMRDATIDDAPDIRELSEQLGYPEYLTHCNFNNLLYP
ncbi:hypothetical protein D3OALGA1CA_2363 [Olavius algarvensis associated proteobacterium Delta 3]|nr:hypothetical protein D3OALGA1CA_2363 [Olavius algarvensis associated proteobacterium Delta 3]